MACLNCVNGCEKCNYRPKVDFNDFHKQQKNTYKGPVPKAPKSEPSETKSGSGCMGPICAGILVVAGLSALFNGNRGDKPQPQPQPPAPEPQRTQESYHAPAPTSTSPSNVDSWWNDFLNKPLLGSSAPQAAPEQQRVSAPPATTPPLILEQTKAHPPRLLWGNIDIDPNQPDPVFYEPPKTPVWVPSADADLIQGCNFPQDYAPVETYRDIKIPIKGFEDHKNDPSHPIYAYVLHRLRVSIDHAEYNSEDGHITIVTDQGERHLFTPADELKPNLQKNTGGMWFSVVNEICASDHGSHYKYWPTRMQTHFWVPLYHESRGPDPENFKTVLLGKNVPLTQRWTYLQDQNRALDCKLDPYYPCDDLRSDLWPVGPP